MSRAVKTLADIGEDELIRLLTNRLSLDQSVIAGVGDDCAVVRAPAKGCHVLLKTDAVVEGVHFTRATSSMLVGRKALARVVSDFAAMGGTPQHALVTLIAPPATAVKRVMDIYRGLGVIAAEFGIAIVGGETSRGRQLALSVSLTGTVPKRKWIGRGGGRAGDVLLVTGRLGGSLHGRHLRFQPRLKEGQWLMRSQRVHAMMDISDGLGKDLPRLARASGVDFVVALADLPRNRGCSAEQAWGDGEDFELLLAVPPRAVPGLLSDWQTQFPKLELTPIGTLVARLKRSQRNAEQPSGWDHFR